MEKKQFIGTSLHTGLKCVCSGEYTKESEYSDNEKPFIFEIVGMNDEWVEMIGRLKTVTENKMIVDCFPIVRPLSDLTKPINHNGEKFVPIERIFEIDYPEHAPKGRNCYYTNPGRFISCSGNWCSSETSINILDMKQNNYWKIKKLIEWHFDIFGLIEKKEAIDINTLSINPYK